MFMQFYREMIDLRLFDYKIYYNTSILFKCKIWMKLQKERCVHV